MKKLSFLILLLAALQSVSVSAQSNNLEQDRQAIRALAGYYKVTFDYAETFAPDTAYKFHPPYHSWGHEWAVIEEDTPQKIVIQHLLVVGDSMVIKHWREDWVYQGSAMYNYDKDNTWKKTKLTPAQTKGRWIQKVYQVDDSPRYESIGTWIHADGRHQWLSEADSPLPRREFTKRNDYNVLRRGNRIYLTPNGWMFEQDNQKVIRSATDDKLLAREKGYEEFTKADPVKFAYAQNWWKGQKGYWKAVREVWDEVYASHTTLGLKPKVDGKLLFENLFDLAERSEKEKWDATKSKSETRKIIIAYII